MNFSDSISNLTFELLYLYLINSDKPDQMLKTSIIDDDKLSRFVVKKYIDKTNFLHFHKEYESAIDAAEDPEINSADIIILDGEMPRLSGLDFLDKMNLKPKVIITSINCEYAVKAFDFNVIDFLAKPVSFSRFLQSVYRAQTRIESEAHSLPNGNHIYIRSNNGYTRINFEEILYVEAYSDYMNIHTQKERFTALSTMKAIEERLPKDKFIRVHRSYLVHIDKINRFEDNMIRLGDKIIPVSRSCRENLVKQLNFF